MISRAVALSLVAAGVGLGAPVAWVAYGAGAPGRVDSPDLWWERVRRLPAPVLVPPERRSASSGSGLGSQRHDAELKVLERRGLPTQSPVVAMAERSEVQGAGGVRP